MKKAFKVILLVMALMFLSVQLASAQVNWVTANQGTFYWDAVTGDTDGNPVPAGLHVEYRVFVIDSLTDVAAVFEETTALESTVTIPAPGRYWVGLKTLLKDDGSGEVVQESDNMSRSDVVADCAGGSTFGFQMLAVFLNPGNMRPTP